MTATTTLLKDLEDPDKFSVEEEAEIFDEHEVKDADGKVIRQVTKHDLEEYAKGSNQRDKEGCPASMTIGHTVDDAPETAQPPVVGYWRKFKVRKSKEKDRWVLVATPYVMRAHLKEAKSYPKVSVEAWRTRKVLDPIAIMRRTPDRPMQWTHSMARWAGKRAKGDLPYRYSMEGQAMDPTDSPDAAAPSEAELSQNMKCCMANFPHLKGYHDKHMAAAMTTPNLAGLDPEAPGVAEPNPAGEGKPEQYGARQIAYEAEQNRVVATLRKQVEELQKFNMATQAQLKEATEAVGAMQRETRLTARRGELEDISERYCLNVDKELEEWGDVAADKFAAHIDTIKSSYRPNPTINLLANTYGGPVHGKGKNDEYTAEKSELVRKYMAVKHKELQAIDSVEERFNTAKKAVMAGWKD